MKGTKKSSVGLQTSIIIHQSFFRLFGEGEAWVEDESAARLCLDEFPAAEVLLDGLINGEGLRGRPQSGLGEGGDLHFRHLDRFDGTVFDD